MAVTYLLTVLLVMTGIAVSKKLHFNLFHAIFFILNCWIALAFLTTFVLNFRVSVFLIVIGSICFCIFSILKKPINLDGIKHISKRDFVFVIFIIVIVNNSIKSEFRLSHWDEFSTWGANVKALLLENNFASLESVHAFMSDGYFLTYPPTSTLVEAIFAFGGEYSERRVIYGLVIYVIFGTLTVASHVVKTRKLQDYLLIMLSFGLSYQFGFFLNNLYVDLLMAILFLSALLMQLTPQASSFRMKLSVSLVMMNLVLLKPNSIVLVAVLMLLNIVRDSIFAIRSQVSPKSSFRNSILVWLPSVIAFLLWRLHVASLDIKMASSSYLGTGRLLEGFWTTMQAYFLEMKSPLITFPGQLQDFLKTMGGPISLSMNQVFAILTILSLSMIIGKTGHIAHLKSALIWIFVFVIYEISLIVAYVSVFSAYESSRVASLERYNAVIFYGWTLWLFFSNWDRYGRFQHGRVVLSSIFLFVAFYSFPQPAIDDIRGMNIVPKQAIYSYQQETRYSLALRDEVEKKLREIPNLQTKDNLYFIDQNSTGLSSYMFSYLGLPNKSNYGCWSIGRKYSENDVWTCPGDLSTFLRDYQYLVILSADKEFWDANLKYFMNPMATKSQSIYKISWNGDYIQLENVLEVSK